MPNKPYIFLADDSARLGLLLIVEYPTGVEYGNQCAGYTNQEMRAEGFLIPLGDHNKERELYNFFWTEFRGNCYVPYNEWTAERTGKLSDIIREIACWYTEFGKVGKLQSLKLDERRMDECVEAWIPVISPYGKGILTLMNSD